MPRRVEVPDMSDDTPKVALGRTVYDEHGEELGTVRGFDDDGFFVTTREGVNALSIEHERAGHEFGEAELMWRCAECGELGDLQEAFPEACPNCGVEKEALYYWIED